MHASHKAQGGILAVRSDTFISVLSERLAALPSSAHCRPSPKHDSGLHLKMPSIWESFTDVYEFHLSSLISFPLINGPFFFYLL